MKCSAGIYKTHEKGKYVLIHGNREHERCACAFFISFLLVVTSQTTNGQRALSPVLFWAPAGVNFR